MEREPSACLVEFDMATIPDGELAAIIAWLCSRGRALGERGAAGLLTAFFNAEAYRRKLTPDEPAERYHAIPLDLDDHTLADAMLLLHCMTYSVGLGERVCKFLGGLATQAMTLCACRLRDGSLRIPPPEVPPVEVN